MADIEVHIDFAPGLKRVGTLHRRARRGAEAISLRPRILTTNITLDEATCDLDLVLSTAEFFRLGLRDAKGIVREVAKAASDWRNTAAAGAPQSEIRRMATAFEHNDMTRALAL